MINCYSQITFFLCEQITWYQRIYSYSYCSNCGINGIEYALLFCYGKKGNKQWCNSGVGEGQSTSLRFSPGNFCWSTGKREARKKGKMENKIEKNCIREGGKLKTDGGKYENGQRIFFFFLFFFHLWDFETTEICFGCTKIKFSTGKKHFTPVGTKSRKVTLPANPLKNIPLAPVAARHYISAS